MCWSAPVSMNTWLLAAFAAAIGLFNGYNNIAQIAFFLSFSSMQLVEYFLWTYLKDPTANALISKTGYALISAQPLFSILQVTNPAQLYPLLGLYAAFTGYALYISQSLNFSTTVATNGHLMWKWLPSDNLIYMGLYMLLLLAPLYLMDYKITLTVGIATLLVSLITYGAASTWGSMWCWFAALSSFWIIGASAMKAGACAK
jgi:hypothetical protein